MTLKHKNRNTVEFEQDSKKDFLSFLSSFKDKLGSIYGSMVMCEMIQSSQGDTCSSFFAKLMDIRVESLDLEKYFLPYRKMSVTYEKKVKQEKRAAKLEAKKNSRASKKIVDAELER